MAGTYIIGEKKYVRGRILMLRKRMRELPRTS